MTNKRLYDKEHTVLRKHIERLNREIKTEKLVSERIRDFYGKKAQVLHDLNEERNNLQN